MNNSTTYTRIAVWVGCTQLHPKHREKSSTTAGESDFTMPRKVSLQIRTDKPELTNSCFQTSLSQQGGLLNCCTNIWTKTNISAKRSAHQPHVVLPVKLRCPVRKLTCVSRQTCLNKSGKRHSKLSMETGTTIKTAASPPVCVMPTYSFNASALRPEIISSMHLVLSDPSRLLPSWIACASFILPTTRLTLAPQSHASHYMHVNNFALEALRVFEAVWQV